MSDAIYQSDPDAAPDRDFIAGRLEHLVEGNRGRLLDVRRTPIVITAVSPDGGEFELEVGAFEDAGARWQLPLPDVVRLQFASDAATAGRGQVAELEAAAARFDVAARLDCDPAARKQTLARIAATRTAVRRWLALGADVPVLDLDGHVASRVGSPALAELTEAFLEHRGVLELDRALAERLVSNPASGELVKGHAIVLAELGLCSYHGTIVRSSALFEEPWSKARRAEHLVSRLALMHELWAVWGCQHVTLYRGLASDTPLQDRSPPSLVSATFSPAVAHSHFQGGPTTHTALLWRQVVDTERLLMTFLETPAMNHRFHEAEAVLIGDGGALTGEGSDEPLAHEPW